ncbi:hypothetical protein RM549_08825 [Salegentibacter sp. F188]|uniref:DUF4468 domain-containing protein n=1 Tax=Autumnicola patrickiae TaxID=3075591 RepID=A0ABU3E1N8_9FLAO|nr:hypothetical protein [Salegentibacter sp. F188]MDT0689887.1 hypothetical protein [Salegentibacter sp. F188]
MKSLLAGLMILIPFISVSQSTNTADKFSITPEGFTQSVVREYTGKTDSDLYESIILWAKYTIDNYESAIVRDVSNEYIEFRMFVPQGIALEEDGEVYKWDVMMEVGFRLRDQEIRYDIGLVEVSSPDAPTFALEGAPNEWSFFDNDGQTRSLNEKSQEQINLIANNVIRSVSAYVNRDAEIPEEEISDE